MAATGARERPTPDGPGASEPVAEVRGLRMRYGTKDVLSGVDLRIERGEVLTLLGPNGAGKTTLIEILEGFRGRSAGDVQVLGADPLAGNEAWRARVGVVLQSWRDHARWRVRETLEVFGAHYAPYSTQRRPRPREVSELLGVVGLAGQADTKVGALSGGQRRRLDVAVGIVGRPELLFLDEPTAGFDPQARAEFHDLVHRLADEDETTILLTTHDLDEAEKLADRIVLLAGGHIVADGSPPALADALGGDTEVRWRRGGERFVHSAADGTAFVRDLFDQHGDEISDLEVHRARLEDVYMDLVRKHEDGAGAAGREGSAS